jgi:peptidoglycan/xylan/chitin deacetylase (PgdA/CDA1 family)
MIRLLKKTLLRAASASGFTSLVLNSRWRAERLLILCYHGLSLDDEHEWNPGEYITPEQFRSRLEILRDSDCNVLPLGEGLDRLYAGTLPPRSVVLTFDDGTYDFYKHGYPLLREFQMPATVYLTTYYCDYNRPVFDVMCSYLLWKARRQELVWPEVVGENPNADAAIRSFAKKQKLSGKQKDELLITLAEKLQLDYETICAKRILHIMTAEEAAEVSRGGIDLQLHTHRHKVSIHEANVRREIDDNRSRLVAITGEKPRHFCYPGGVYLPEFPGWLKQWDVISATTCSAGLASRASDRMLLPRLIDVTPMSSDEFSAWLSGIGSLLPRRSHPTAEGQFMDETD